MASEWQEAPLGEMFDLINGYAFKSKEFTSSGIPVIKIKNVKAGYFSEQDFSYVSPDFLYSRSNKIAQRGDLLISMSGNRQNGSPETWVGKVAHFKKGGLYLINQRVGALRARKEYDVSPQFMAYVLSSWDFQNLFISIATSSGGQANISPTQILRTPVPVPPIQEQRAIADILGTLDDKIELNRQINRTLEAMARAIFKAWFVDFEPVKAKAAGSTSFRGMPQSVFDQLPDRFTDTELGPVPEGWEVKPISSMASISRESVTPADSPDERFEHFSIPAFDAGMRPAQDLGGSIRSNKYVVSPYCVLVSKLNPRFARVWLPDDPEKSGRQICSTEFLVVTPKEGWSREHLYCQFVEAGFRQDLQRRASGTSNSHQRIKPKDFEKTVVVSPPARVREAFSESVGPLFAKKANGHKESQTLAAVRDTLLPQLISGELRVEPSEPSATEAACR